MKKLAYAALGGLSLLSAPVFAAIPAASLTALQTEITDDAEAVITMAFAVMIVVVGALIGVKLVKKFASRAT